jgi:hypothetical protein
VNLEISSPVLTYSPLRNMRYLSFCIKSNIPEAIQSIPVSLVLGGTNSGSYSFSNPEITI